MCRVALMNKEGYQYINKKVGALEFFDFLEISNGGHGNGVALLLENGRVLIKKGTGVTNLDIVNYIENHKEKVKWILYHTRISSVGSINSANCHPFKYGNLVLAMNGTESGFSSLGTALGMTDTEAIALTIHKIGIEPQQLTSKLKSVFMGFYNKRPFVTCGSEWSDIAVLENKKGLVFASEFPKELDGVKYPAQFPFIWEEGKKLNLTEFSLKKYNKYYGYYGYYYDDYPYYGRVKTITKTEENQKEGTVK